MKRKSIEVRWHGRGGQGAVTAANILAEAAYYEGYKGVTAAPFFGAERRGAPVIASNRFGWEPIKTFSLVENPDVVVVLDETLLTAVNVAAGIRPDGIVIINTAKPPETVLLKAAVNIATTNAFGWAKEAGLTVSGSVLFNTTILGGFARLDMQQRNLLFFGPGFQSLGDQLGSIIHTNRSWLASPLQ